MCPTTPVPLDVPAILYVVARREDGWPHRPTYYAGPVKGWALDINEACVWCIHEHAQQAAWNFPHASALRVLVWHPLPVMVHPDDQI